MAHLVEISEEDSWIAVASYIGDLMNDGEVSSRRLQIIIHVRTKALPVLLHDCDFILITIFCLRCRRHLNL